MCVWKQMAKEMMEKSSDGIMAFPKTEIIVVLMCLEERKQDFLKTKKIRCWHRNGRNPNAEKQEGWMKCTYGAWLNILKLTIHSKILSTRLHVTMVLSVATATAISKSLESIKMSILSHKFAHLLFDNSGCDMSVHSFLGCWGFFHWVFFEQLLPFCTKYLYFSTHI